MRSSPGKRWTKAEKWLFVAPVVVGIFAFIATIAPDWARKKRGLPRELATSTKAVVSGVALSLDGSTLAANEQWIDSSKANANLIYLWDSRTLKPLHSISRPIVRDRWGLDKRTRSVAVSPDGTLIASATHSSIQVVDRKKERRLWQRPGFVNDIEFSPDGKYVAFKNHNYQVLDALTGRTVTSWKTLPEHGDDTLTFSHDGKWLASCAARPRWEEFRKAPNKVGGEIELRRVEDWKQQRTFPLPNTRLIAFSPDGNKIIGVASLFAEPPVLSYDGSYVQCFDRQTGRVLWQINTKDKKTQGIYRSFNAVCFSPDNSLVALEGWTDDPSQKIFLLDANTGRLRRTLSVPIGKGSTMFLPHGLIFSPDGKRLFGRGKSAVLVWDLD